MFSQHIADFYKVTGASKFYCTFLPYFKEFYQLNNYKVEQVYKECDETRNRVGFCLDPQSESHRYMYVHFNFDTYNNRKTFCYELLGSPQSVANTVFLKQMLFNKVKDLVDVPEFSVQYLQVTGIEQPTKIASVRLNGKTLSYSSKTQVLKLVVPQMARLIEAPSGWEWAEKCALARNLISESRSVKNYKLFIGRILLMKIERFLFSFSFSNLKPCEIFSVFSHYYKLDSQYILYKIEKPSDKISGNPTTSELNTIEHLEKSYKNKTA